MNMNLQSPYSDDEPGQEEPPFLAVGLLHDLYLFFSPVSVSHELHELQGPQLALTRPVQ